MRIVFMGTPEFAVPSLDILIRSPHEVVGVVTATDKMGGRNNNQLIESAVKKYAVQNNLRILQPSNLKAPGFLEELASLKADLQIVVAFRMLPELVWNMPPLGTYNLHGSLLPKYRGAAPINWAIIRGEHETGITSFKLKHEIDTGDILFQEKLPIFPDETAGELHDRMMELAAGVTLKTVQRISEGPVELYSQVDSESTRAPKIFREDCAINWNDTTENVYNFIRGLSPYPTAWTMINDKVFKLFSVRKLPPVNGTKPGKHLTDNRSYLHFSTQNGAVECLEVQLQGKKKMDIKSFLNGNKL
jgi:methionyl-tRNA formyltransferase